MHLKKNDMVVVLSGKDTGKKGKVLVVYPETQRAIVEKVNFIKRHTRPNPNKGIQGGIAEKEAPIHVSNLMVVCPDCGSPSRPRRKRLEDGTSVRTCRKCGHTLA